MSKNLITPRQVELFTKYGFTVASFHRKNQSKELILEPKDGEIFFKVLENGCTYGIFSTIEKAVERYNEI